MMKPINQWMSQKNPSQRRDKTRAIMQGMTQELL